MLLRNFSRRRSSSVSGTETATAPTGRLPSEGANVVVVGVGAGVMGSSSGLPFRYARVLFPRRGLGACGARPLHRPSVVTPLRYCCAESFGSRGGAEPWPDGRRPAYEAGLFVLWRPREESNL